MRPISPASPGCVPFEPTHRTAANSAGIEIFELALAADAGLALHVLAAIQPRTAHVAGLAASATEPERILDLIIIEAGLAARAAPAAGRTHGRSIPLCAPQRQARRAALFALWLDASPRIVDETLLADCIARHARDARAIGEELKRMQRAGLAR